MKEIAARSRSGLPVLFVLIALLAADGWWITTATPSPLGLLAGAVVGIVLFVCLFGLYMVEPNQAAVLSLFGKYVGTDRTDGLRWNNPFYSKKKVSLRVRNFESGKLKVNELDGSPIEIASVIVWQIVDSAEAVFNVDDYESFVHIQAEPPRSASTSRRSSPSASPTPACT